MSMELYRDLTAPMAQVLQIRGHKLHADADEEAGVSDSGPSRQDLSDAAVAACRAITVMWCAWKKGIPVDDVHTVVERVSSQERSGIYKLSTRLRIGGALTYAQLVALTNVAQTCPVHKLMMAVTTESITNVERMA
jgi:putative redox protein